MRPIPVLICVLLIAACKPYETEPLLLDVTLQSDRATAAPGDSVQFEVRAQGGALIGVGVNWDDGTELGIPASGAQTLRTLQRHAFANPGVYDVVATVSDAFAGQKTAQLTVRIQ